MKGKNGSDKKVKKIEFKLVYSETCQKCLGCEAGKLYLQGLNIGGKFGNGIVCKFGK